MRWILWWRSRRLRRWSLFMMRTTVVIIIHVFIDCGRLRPAASITWTWWITTSRRGILRFFLNAGYVLYVRQMWFHNFITILPYKENNRVFLRILQELFQLDCASRIEFPDNVFLPVSPFPCQKSDHGNEVIQGKVYHLSLIHI